MLLAAGKSEKSPKSDLSFADKGAVISDAGRTRRKSRDHVDLII
jgi:hypothetical protein